MANELKHKTVGGELTQAEFEDILLHVLDSQAAGDVIYASSTTQLSRLAKSSDGEVLTLASGLPSWAAAAGGGGLSIFGDGSDGDVTISSNTNLSRDMFYDDLTIDSTYTLSTKGYRIFVKGTLTNNGTIERNGNAGVADAGGAALAAASLGGSAAGDDGANPEHAGGGGGGGVLFIAAKTIVNSSGVISANGGVGGDAPADPGSAVGGGNGGATTSSLGGAGGDGGDTTGESGGTGGTVTAPAATEGHWRAIHAAVLLRLASAVTLITGGGGGASGPSDNTNSQSGGGGGGGGGCLVIIYNSLTTGTETVNGGTGGAGWGGGNAGDAGSNGTVIKIANA